jgi:2-(1,2-epoxy-1,2-dihydrophenyl)acetyl-CoA isomerase
MATERIEYARVRLEIEGGLATIVLADPERLNALSGEMVLSVINALQEIAKPRRAIRCVVLTGEGRGFCSGANLAGPRQTTESAGSSASPNLKSLGAVETLFHPLVRKLRDVEVPVVAAVNGPCVGFGVAMALTADHIIASDAAYFLVPFRNLASCLDSGLSWALPRAVGINRARQMILRAIRVDAATALSWGLVAEVAPADGFRAAARRVADEFAAGPTVALGLMRRLLLDSDRRSFDEQLEAELKGVAVTSRTKDNAAAISLFGSKTKPEFTGS